MLQHGIYPLLCHPNICIKYFIITDFLITCYYNICKYWIDSYFSPWYFKLRLDYLRTFRVYLLVKHVLFLFWKKNVNENYIQNISSNILSNAFWKLTKWTDFQHFHFWNKLKKPFSFTLTKWAIKSNSK